MSNNSIFNSIERMIIVEILNVLPLDKNKVICFLDTGHAILYNASWLLEKHEVLNDPIEFRKRLTIDGGFLAFEVRDGKNPITLDSEVIFNESKIIYDDEIEDLLSQDNNLS